MRTSWNGLALVLSVAGGVMAGTAAGQTPPRIDYRVLAEFSASPSGPWPHVVGEVSRGGPILSMQFPDGGVLWQSDARMLWIDDQGVRPVLAPGTRIPGLPDEDFRFFDSSFQQPPIRLDDGRVAFRVRYEAIRSGSRGETFVVGTPLQPELADTRVPSVSNQGLARVFTSPFDLVGPFGGVLEPFLTPGMPIVGIAPAEATLRNQREGVLAPFGPEGSLGVRGTSASGEEFDGLYKNGVLRAVRFGTTVVPGVSMPITRDGAFMNCVLRDGSVLMTESFRRGTWIVYPDDTGRDLVTPLTVLPGYPSNMRMTGCDSTATADGRIYALVQRVSDGGSSSATSALYEFEDNQLRLIVRTGDPRLRLPDGRSVAVMPGAAGCLPGSGNWISSGGRIAWLWDGFLVFAHRSGAIALARWPGMVPPAALEAFGQVQLFGVQRLSCESGISTDMPSRSTRMALDGSLAFFMNTEGGVGNRFRTFLVSARLNLCPPDVNEDGFVDFFDYGVFVDCFESGQGCGRFNVGDFNQDGFTDFFDYAAFVEAFEVGC